MCVQAIGAIIRSWPHLDLVYSFLWSLLALFIPLLILTVCNVCLIRALRQSRRLQIQCRASCRGMSDTTAAGRNATGSGNSGKQRITPTLVALIVVFTVCVGPSGLLDFFRQHIIQNGPQGSQTMFYAYQTATVIINCLYLVNFAVNFVLYCVVNVQFRRTVRDVFCGMCSSLGIQTGMAYRGQQVDDDTYGG